MHDKQTMVTQAAGFLSKNVYCSMMNFCVKFRLREKSREENDDLILAILNLVYENYIYVLYFFNVSQRQDSPDIQ